MKLEWQVEDSDIIRVKEFYDEHKDSDFVTHRREVNVERKLPEFSQELSKGRGQPLPCRR